MKFFQGFVIFFVLINFIFLDLEIVYIEMEVLYKKYLS